MEASPTKCVAGDQEADEDFVYYYDGYDHWGSIGQPSMAAGEIQGLIPYKPPRRDEACRVCKTLEANGDTQLYDGHDHRFPTGCPRYVALSAYKGLKMIANICLFCHDPDYIWKPGDQDHKLKCVNHDKGKSGYFCQVQSCKQPGTVNGAEQYKAKNANVKEEKIVKTKSPENLKLKKMMTKSKGGKAVQVKEVKSDFESPETAPILASS